MTGGTVVVNGPTNDGNAAIDVNGTFDISGGTLTAAGSAGMAETPDATSAQAWLSATFNATQPAGAVITIEAGDTVVATFTATKQMQSLRLLVGAAGHRRHLRRPRRRDRTRQRHRLRAGLTPTPHPLCPAGPTHDRPGVPRLR